jgi:hypothetical protein
MTLVTVKKTARQLPAVRVSSGDAHVSIWRPATRARSLAERLRQIRTPGRQPTAPLLRLSWAEAPDGRGLVACWSEEVARWQAPVTLHARRPSGPGRRTPACGPRLPHPLTRLAAA